jgi:RNA polymerase sigma-70 factor, ECF subfamily
MSAAPEFTEVYAEYFDLVFRNLSRMGLRRPALEDALQDVFLVVHRRLPDFEQRSQLKTWVFGITLRVASDYLRRNKRYANRQDELSPELEDQAARDPSEQFAARQAVELLHAVLGELDEQKRAVFILAEIEEMSAPEIAQAVGTNVNTVASRLRAARRRFAEALGRRRAQELWRQVP